MFKFIFLLCFLNDLNPKADKNTDNLVKVKGLVQLLYSSKSKKVQVLKCTQWIKYLLIILQ